jgi:hypothetical protein
MICNIISQHSSVNIVIGYRLDVRGSIPDSSKPFFSASKCPNQLRGIPSSLLSKGYFGLFSWGRVAWV